MDEAAAKIAWLPLRAGIGPIARHLGYPTENARLRIIRYVKARRIRMRYRTDEGLLVYATGHGEIDWSDESIELCLDNLIETDLLPAPGRPERLEERARQPADRAIAYLITGYLVEWGDWTPEMIREREQAETDLGQAISEGVPAWGWHPLERRRKRIPSDHFRAEMIERKEVLPVSVAHWPKVVVRIGGNVGTSPLSRTADYRGPRWEAIEVDFAALRQARPRPVTTQAEPEPVPPTESQQPSSPKLSVQEPPPEEAEQQPDEPQFEGPKKWRPEEVPKWFRHVRTTYPRKPGETKSAYADRLHKQMTKDFDENPPWSDAETVRRRLNDPDYA